MDKESQFFRVNYLASHWNFISTLWVPQKSQDGIVIKDIKNNDFMKTIIKTLFYQIPLFEK